MKINVIIPMGGEGSRFGYVFKPFVYLDNRMFIEHVMDSFKIYDKIINFYIFIITEEQEDRYNVTNTINKIFEEKIIINIIKNKTEGPYQTIINGIKENYENIIICDCDHQINIEPIIKYLENNESPDIIIPTWEIKKEDQKNWGKIVLKKEKIVNIVEKEELELKKEEEIYGMIGCYYFKNRNIIEDNNKYINISDYLKEKRNELKIIICKIREAYFFGTPEMVKNYIKNKRCNENIICDVDGVLFKHSPHSNNNIEDNELIGNCKNIIKKWKEDNKKIILMTARSKRTEKEFKILLENKGILYDELIMGVNPGTRYVINDIKPSNIFTRQSIEINLERDNGIDEIICEEYLNNKIKILDIFKGGSFSKIYLLENNNYKYLRKHIIKNKINMEHYYRLKRQAEDLRRFYYYDNNLVPKFIKEHETNDEYYYDMEYLEEYKQLNTYDRETQNRVLIRLLSNMKESIYIYRKEIKGNNFINEYFEEKIYPKINKFSNECKIMNYLINEDEVKINGKKYYGLKKIFDEINIYEYSPTFICPIHGDLNFENILYNINNDDVKVIDMEGSRYVDSPVFDLAKIFQSIISKYEIWSNIDKVIIDNNIDNLICIDDYFMYDKSNLEIIDFFKEIFNINDNNYIIKIGIFYMATYFIRFIPFRLKISNDHGVFAMIMAIIWLNNIK